MRCSYINAEEKYVIINVSQAHHIQLTIATAYIIHNALVKLS